MAELVTQPTGQPTRKVKAGSGGAGVGAPIGFLFATYLAGQYPEFFASSEDVFFNVEVVVTAATTTAFGAIGAFATAYMTRERAE